MCMEDIGALDFLVTGSEIHLTFMLNINYILTLDNADEVIQFIKCHIENVGKWKRA